MNLISQSKISILEKDESGDLILPQVVLKINIYSNF